MSGYHFNVKFISRGAGQSVVAKGAYHARAEFREERTGELKDYTYKNDRSVWSGVFADKDAPASFRQNESLLNEIDRRERRKDAQTALNFTGALPEKLTDEERQRMVRDFAREEFVRKHLAAVAHIHRPSEKGDDRNHHVHMLVATRTVGPDGFGDKFITRENYGQHLEHWREKWAELGARYLENAGHKIEAERWRAGHLDLERQSQAAFERGDLAEAETLKNKQATKHRGPAVDAMERKGQQTERGNIHRDIVERNDRAATIPGLKLELADIQKQIAEFEREALRAAERERGTLARAALTQQPPENPGAVDAVIWSAYRRSKTPVEFAGRLAKDGIKLAVTLDGEAQRSVMQANAAKEQGRFATVYREGEIVAVTDRGNVYLLNRRTTGTDRPEVEKFMAGIDRAALRGIDETRGAMQQRREAALIERAMIGRANDNTPSAAAAITAGRAVLKVGDTAHRAVSGAANAAGKAASIADGVANAIGGILSFLIPPPPRTYADRKADEAEAESANIADRKAAYDREFDRLQEQRSRESDPPQEEDHRRRADRDR